MKIQAVKTLISFIIMLIALNVNAQEQYHDLAITQNGDSIRCSINPFPAIGAVKYKSALMVKPEKLDPTKIKEYYTLGFKVHIRAVFINDSKTPVYMKVVENGKICLYEKSDVCAICAGATATDVSDDDWYIAKGTDHATCLRTTGIFFDRQKRKNDFGQMLKDNQSVYNQYLAEDKFSFAAIRNFVHLYNTGEPLKKGS
jgi:hypothetical protein